MATKPLIHFHYQIAPFSFRNRLLLKSFITSLVKDEGHALTALNFIFCDDAYLLDINRTYLNHDTLTDIITFPYSAPGESIISDIYISIPRIKENAKTFETSFQLELHRVIFHGVLHLCGYKDKSKQDKKIMRNKEDEYLAKYFVPRGTKPHQI